MTYLWTTVCLDALDELFVDTVRLPNKGEIIRVPIMHDDMLTYSFSMIEQRPLIPYDLVLSSTIVAR